MSLITCAWVWTTTEAWATYQQLQGLTQVTVAAVPSWLGQPCHVPRSAFKALLPLLQFLSSFPPLSADIFWALAWGWRLIWVSFRAKPLLLNIWPLLDIYTAHCSFDQLPLVRQPIDQRPLLRLPSRCILWTCGCVYIRWLVMFWSQYRPAAAVSPVFPELTALLLLPYESLHAEKHSSP